MCLLVSRKAVLYLASVTKRHHPGAGQDEPPMHILHIDASAGDGATSHSRRLSAGLVEKLKAADAGATVTYPATSPRTGCRMSI